MGREARCACRWGSHNGIVTVHLDSATLGVRGDLHARLPLASVRDVTVRGDDGAALGPGARAAAALAREQARIRRDVALPDATLAIVRTDDRAELGTWAAGIPKDGPHTAALDRLPEGPTCAAR